MSEDDHVEGTEYSAVEVEHQHSGRRRTAQILGAVVVGVALPALLVGLLIGEFAAYALLVGLLLGGVGSKIGGTHRMLALAPVVGLAAGLGAFTAYDWWWAALLASTGVLTGAGIGFGWLAPLLMVPYAATFVSPATSARDAVIYGVVVAIGTLYGIVIARRFGASEVVDGQRLPLPAASVAGSNPAPATGKPRKRGFSAHDDGNGEAVCVV